MEPITIGYLGIGAMLALILFTGMSPGLAMLLTGFGGLLALNPPQSFSAMLGGVNDSA